MQTITTNEGKVYEIEPNIHREDGEVLYVLKESILATTEDAPPQVTEDKNTNADELPTLMISRLDSKGIEDNVRADFLKDKYIRHSSIMEFSIKTNGYYIDTTSVSPEIAVKYFEDLTGIKCYSFVSKTEKVQLEFGGGEFHIMSYDEYDLKKYVRKQLTPITIPQRYVEQHTSQEEQKSEPLDESKEEELMYKVGDEVVLKKGLEIKLSGLKVMIESKKLDKRGKTEYRSGRGVHGMGKNTQGFFYSEDIDHDATAKLNSKPNETKLISVDECSHCKGLGVIPITSKYVKDCHKCEKCKPTETSPILDNPVKEEDADTVIDDWIEDVYTSRHQDHESQQLLKLKIEHHHTPRIKKQIENIQRDYMLGREIPERLTDILHKYLLPHEPTGS